jgi:hypothetical protein
MSNELAEYLVIVHGVATTMQLSERDAKRLKGKPVVVAESVVVKIDPRDVGDKARRPHVSR